MQRSLYFSLFVKELVTGEFETLTRIMSGISTMFLFGKLE